MTGLPNAILMGSKPGSVVALEIMLELGWDVRRVVVPKAPPDPWVPGPSLEDSARAHGIEVCLQAELPGDLTADFVISYMYRNLVRPETLRMATRGAFNFHAAPLPGFGGWAFYNVAILEAVAEYGVTAHWMDEGFDTGPLFRVRRFPVEIDQMTAVSLEARAQDEMIQLFREFCEIASSGDPLPKEEQDPEQMRYMTRDEFEVLRQIPADADAETVDRYARAFWYPPYDCAWTVVNGVRVEVVPTIAKEGLATLIHADDLARVRSASGVLDAAH